MRHAALLTMAGALAPLLAACSPAPDETVGYVTLSKARVPADGGAASTAPLRSDRDFEQRVLITGTFLFGHDGTSYDARYRCYGGVPGEPHEYVTTDPPDLVLVREDKYRHTYAYALPRGADMAGRSVTVAIDTSRFVEQYFLTPSEVKAALTSHMDVTLHARPMRGPSALARLLARWPIALTALVLLGSGLAAFGGLALGRATTDVAKRVRRIDRTFALIERATAGDQPTFAPVVKQLGELRDTAHRIAQESERTAKALKGVDRQRLRVDIAQLERRVERAASEETRTEYEAALAERRRALDSVDDLAARRELAVVRVTKIEGVFDSSLLRIRESRLRVEEDQSDKSTIPDILEQLATVRDAITQARGELGL